MKIKTGWKLVKKTVEATIFSERTVNRMLLEKRKLGKAQFTSPQKCYKITKGGMAVDDFDAEVIRFTLSAVKELTYEGCEHVGEEVMKR